MKYFGGGKKLNFSQRGTPFTNFFIMYSKSTYNNYVVDQKAAWGLKSFLLKLDWKMGPFCIPNIHMHNIFQHLYNELTHATK